MIEPLILLKEYLWVPLVGVFGYIFKSWITKIERMDRVQSTHSIEIAVLAENIKEIKDDLKEIKNSVQKIEGKL